jgi:serine/threonine-protein kinase HipA
MSMLGAKDGDAHTYPEIADVIRQHGTSVREDLAEMFRRMVFSVLISNTDDHLRNHGFLYEGQTGWRLSPAFDLNPVPVDIRPRQLSTALVLDGDPTASLDLAFESAEYFDLDEQAARHIAAEVATAVATWRQVAGSHGIATREIDRMESAFEHDDLTVALKIAGAKP